MSAVLLSMCGLLLFLSYSVSLSYFIVYVPMCNCWGQHSCMSSTFPTPILNVTIFFCESNRPCRLQSRTNQKITRIQIILINRLYLYHEWCGGIVFQRSRDRIPWQHSRLLAWSCTVQVALRGYWCKDWGVTTVNWIYRLWRHWP